MMLFVFAQLYLGFTVIGIKYSLILALVVAFIDLLPVLGVGTVLIPWGLIGLISGDVRTGVGLLILFGIMSVIRQFSEPHIIGTALGIPSASCSDRGVLRNGAFRTVRSDIRSGRALSYEKLFTLCRKKGRWQSRG